MGSANMDPEALKNTVKLVGMMTHLGATKPGANDPTMPGVTSQMSDAPPAEDVNATGEVARADINRGTRKLEGHGKAALAPLKYADKLGKDAIAKSTDVATREAEISKPVLEQAGQDSANRDADFQARLARIEQHKTEGLNRYLAAVDDLKNTHVYSWWSQAGTGASILGIISQALAGGLQGLTGQSGPTPLDRVIDQELQRQKTNIAVKSDTAQQSGNLYHQLVQQFGDEVQAESAFRTIAAHSTGVRIDGLVASIGGDKAKAKQAQMQAELQASTAKGLAPVQMKLGEDAAAQENTKGDSGLKASQIATEQRGQNIAAKARAPGPIADLEGIPGSGAKLMARRGLGGPEAVNALMTRWDAVGHVKANADEISKLLVGTETDANGKTIDVRSRLSTADFAARLDQAAYQISEDLAVVGHLGAISKADENLVKKIAGFPGGWEAFVEGHSPDVAARTYKEFSDAVQRLAKSSDERVRREVNNLKVAP